MSKLTEKIELYTKSANDLGLGINEDFLAKVTKGLGPSIYNRDAQTVSCSDTTELDRLKNNFLKKKLGLSDSDNLDDAIKEVCQKLGSSNKNKYRALFYALLVIKYKKESVYS